jgi:serine/threonine protein phosphatase PrpC
MTYLLVADGHGGPSVAERAADQLLPEIARLANNETMEAVMRDSFLRFHRAAQQDKDSAGTTCTVVAINQRTRLITCANVGDSQAYLVLSESIVPLGIDHRLECNAEERERVVADGGVVARALAPTGERRAVGPLRAWPGGLAMGRSLGDRDCGEWLSPEPSITRTSMPAEGGRVVVCSDGVWDAVSMQAVARLVREGGSPAATAEKVVAKAIRAPVPARFPMRAVAWTWAHSNRPRAVRRRARPARRHVLYDCSIARPSQRVAGSELELARTIEPQPKRADEQRLPLAQDRQRAQPEPELAEAQGGQRAVEPHSEAARGRRAQSVPGSDPPTDHQPQGSDFRASGAAEPRVHWQPLSRSVARPTNPEPAAAGGVQPHAGHLSAHRSSLVRV